MSRSAQSAVESLDPLMVALVRGLLCPCPSHPKHNHQTYLLHHFAHQQQSLLRRRKLDEAAELCSQILERAPYDKAAWFLKARAEAAKVETDEVEMEDEGMAELMMDDNATVRCWLCLVGRGYLGNPSHGRRARTTTHTRTSPIGEQTAVE
jgi:hypothetical protein